MARQSIWRTTPGQNQQSHGIPSLHYSSGPSDNKGLLTTNTWVEYDVTSLLTGNGTYTFALIADSTDGAEFSSREGGAPAQLVITTATATSTLTQTSTLTPTSTCTSTATFNRNEYIHICSDSNSFANGWSISDVHRYIHTNSNLDIDIDPGPIADIYRDPYSNRPGCHRYSNNWAITDTNPNYFCDHPSFANVNQDIDAHSNDHKYTCSPDIYVFTDR